MSEVATSGTMEQVIDHQAPEISYEQTQNLRIFNWCEKRYDSLNKAVQKVGTWLDEKNHAARMAMGGLTLAALTAACGPAEKNAGDIRVFAQPPAETPNAVETIEGLPSQIPTEKSTETSLFQEINKKIDQSPASEAEKVQARETINQFSEAEQKIEEFKNYEAQSQAQGEVTLWQLIQQKFNRLGDTFPEFKIADQVFYLKDENDLKKILNQLKEKSPDELLTSISESQKQFFDEGKPAGRRRYAYITPELAQSPTTEFDLSKTTSPLAPKAAEGFRTLLKEIGLEGKIRLKIILADKLSMGNAAGTFSDMERVPEIELAPPFGEKEFFHELTHFLDPNRNSFLYSYLSSKDIIDTLIAIEEALNSEWGRKYPEVNKIFSKDPINAFVKRQNGQPIGPEEFAVVERLDMPAGGWLTPMNDTLRNPDESFVDFMSIFDNQFSQDFDKKLKNALHEIREEDWSGFVLSQKTLLDELAQRSDWDKAFVELLRENATSVTYSPRYHGALSMPHLRRILFFDAAVGGDARIATLFLNLKPKDREQILNTFLTHFRSNDKEFLADSVAVTISGKSELGFEWDKTLKNPFRTYFDSIISDLTS